MTNLSFRDIKGFQVLDWREGEDPTAEMTRVVREYVKSGYDVYRTWYDDHYCVSTSGSVYTRSKLTDMKWKPLKLTGVKYISISLTLPQYLRTELQQSSRQSWLVHRLVMKTFEGDPPSIQQKDVRHLDGNPRNNKLINLAYGTRKENMADINEYKHKKVELIPEVVTTPKTLYTLQTSAVRESLRAHIKLGYSLAQFAKSLDITTDVARTVLCGEFYARLRQSIEPDQNKFELCLGREGERNHKAKFTEVDLVVALSEYTRNHWSSLQFAESLGIKQATAHAILSGGHWKHVLRPEGFMYPWPDAKVMHAMTGESHPLAEHTEQEMQHLFARVCAEEFASVKDMINKTGMSRSSVYGILRQTAWSSLERPAGFAEAAAKLYTRKSKDTEAQ